MALIEEKTAQVLLCKQLGPRSGLKKFWTQIRPDLMSGLIWVRTFCKVYVFIRGGGELMWRDVFFRYKDMAVTEKKKAQA